CPRPAERPASPSFRPSDRRSFAVPARLSLGSALRRRLDLTHQDTFRFGPVQRWTQISQSAAEIGRVNRSTEAVAVRKKGKHKTVAYAFSGSSSTLPAFINRPDGLQHDLVRYKNGWKQVSTGSPVPRARAHHPLVYSEDWARSPSFSPSDPRSFGSRMRIGRVGVATLWMAIASCAGRPTSLIRSPATGANVEIWAPTSIAGTASGASVAAVDISVDGVTWRRADGRTRWSFDWTPSEVGPVTIRSRALDRSGRREAPAAGVRVTVVGKACPCTIWSSSTMPVIAAS